MNKAAVLLFAALRVVVWLILTPVIAHAMTMGLLLLIGTTDTIFLVLFLVDIVVFTPVVAILLARLLRLTRDSRWHDMLFAATMLMCVTAPVTFFASTVTLCEITTPDDECLE